MMIITLTIWLSPVPQESPVTCSRPSSLITYIIIMLIVILMIIFFPLIIIVIVFELVVIMLDDDRHVHNFHIDDAKFDKDDD